MDNIDNFDGGLRTLYFMNSRLFLVKTCQNKRPQAKFPRRLKN